MSTPVEIARLAAALNVLRPDWPTKSVTTLLQQLAHKPLCDLAVASVAIAVDPASITPKRLLEPGPWWNLAREEKTPQPPPLKLDNVDPLPPERLSLRVTACRQAMAERKRATPPDDADAEPLTTPPRHPDNPETATANSEPSEDSTK